MGGFVGLLELIGGAVLWFILGARAWREKSDAKVVRLVIGWVVIVAVTAFITGLLDLPVERRFGITIGRRYRHADLCGDRLGSRLRLTSAGTRHSTL